MLGYGEEKISITDINKEYVFTQPIEIKKPKDPVIPPKLPKIEEPKVQTEFKSFNILGRSRRENAVRNIVRCKLTDMNAIFFKWRKINNETNVR